MNVKYHRFVQKHGQFKIYKIGSMKQIKLTSKEINQKGFDH